MRIHQYHAIRDNVTCTFGWPLYIVILIWISIAPIKYKICTCGHLEDHVQLISTWRIPERIFHCRAKSCRHEDTSLSSYSYKTSGQFKSCTFVHFITSLVHIQFLLKIAYKLLFQKLMPMSIAPRIMAVYSSLLLTIVVDCSRAFHTPCIDVSGWALWQESYKPDVCLHRCICMHNATAKSSMQLVPSCSHIHTCADRAQALCPGWADVWWVSWCAMQWETCTLLL